jgi:hypothetical protein
MGSCAVIVSLVSLVLAVAVAGCGGGVAHRSPALETGVTTTPKAAFIAQGDAICRTVDAAIAAASARAGRAEQADKVAVGREALGSEVTAAEGAPHCAGSPARSGPTPPRRR